MEESTPGGVHSVGLDTCIMTHIIQCRFIAHSPVYLLATTDLSTASVVVPFPDVIEVE